MRSLAAFTLSLTLALGLFTTAAIAQDRASLEEETLAHLEASNRALDAASAAIDSGNIANSCPHLRKAGSELDAAYDALGRYRQLVQEDAALTTSERDGQVNDLNNLQSQIQQQSNDIDGLLSQYCD